MKVLSLFAPRPKAIGTAPVAGGLANRPVGFGSRVGVTGTRANPCNDGHAAEPIVRCQRETRTTAG